MKYILICSVALMLFATISNAEEESSVISKAEVSKDASDENKYFYSEIRCVKTNMQCIGKAKAPAEAIALAKKNKE